MRVVKKLNKVVEARQTRSCVVRLEKVSTSPNISPSPEENRIPTRASNNLNSSVIAPNSKGRKRISLQKEDKPNSITAKKKFASDSTIVHGSFQTPRLQKGVNMSMSNIRSNQKIKSIPKPTPASTPNREESPPPTIAAGRSRRAIKPNPKYASEDMVTPKVMRNVGMLGSSGIRGGTTRQNKSRKASTSSEDFYNRNSDDEFDNYGNNINNDNSDEHNDKAYQATDKDDQDSDFSVIEESSKRNSRSKRRLKRIHESTHALKPQIDNKLPTQTRLAATVTSNSSNLRSAPSQLQQIRRSLASANAQRNLNVMSGSGAAQKRKIEEIQDSSDNESNYSSKRKQLFLSNSAGHKIKLPVRENKVNSASLYKSRLFSQTQVYKAEMPPQTINGSNKVSNVLASSRRAIEIAIKSNLETINKSTLKQSAITANITQHKKPIQQNPVAPQTKLLTLKTQKLRSGSPKPALEKEKQKNGDVLSLSSASVNSGSTLKTNNKPLEKAKSLSTQSNVKPKITIPANNTPVVHSEVIHEIKDDSPNSTMDDFETMPTFTIVNVNDIINKKGDVLITKSKSNSNKIPTVIELSESISLDDDDDENNINDIEKEMEPLASASGREKQILSKKLPKSTTTYHKNDTENKKSPLNRSNDTLRKLPTQPPTTSSTKQAPQILNHKLGLRNSKITAKTTTTVTATLTSPDKPAPRILNSMVAKKTQPVKPMIANMEDSADESFLLSLDEDEEEDDVDQETDETEQNNTKASNLASRLRKRKYQNLMEVDTEDSESQDTVEDDTLLQNVNTSVKQLPSSQATTALGPKDNTSPQRRRRAIATSNTPLIVSSNKKRLPPPAATKENSLAATNQQVTDSITKQPIASTLPVRKLNTEKVVISKQGDKIIKKETCFETWNVINMVAETKRPTVPKNQLEMPLIQLANQAKSICLPNDMWSCKVTLNELSPQSLVKGTFVTYTGDLQEHNISEEDRGKYQPFCVMFRRSIEKSQLTRMPYDRAVIFKNKTFYTNIEGKNIRLIGAPSVINSESEIEILLEIIDRLTLQNDFVELISVMQ